MKNARRLLAVVIVLVGGALVATIVLKVSSGKRTPPVLPGLPKNVEISLNKIHYTETRDGVKKWDLVADAVEFDKEREITSLKNVRLVVAGDRQTGDITVTADRAEYDNKSKDVRLNGNVVARSTTGMEFTTGKAEYDAAGGVLRTTDRVRFVDKRGTLEGVGMELVTGTRNLKIRHDVTAHIIPGAGK